MILSELRDYLRERRRVALADLVNHFDSDADAIRGMLGKLIRKGRLRKLTVSDSCGSSCCKCDPLQTELYEWLDNGRH